MASSAITILLDDHEVYDRVIKNSIPDEGDLTLVTKDHGMQSGRAIAMLTFHVHTPDGERKVAQTVVSVRILMTMLAALKGRYTDDGDLRPPPVVNRG